MTEHLLLGVFVAAVAVLIALFALGDVIVRWGCGCHTCRMGWLERRRYFKRLSSY